jgi:HD-like signal output (HDOD) protein
MTTTPVRDVSEPSDALERRLRFILRAGDFPALSNMVAETMSISLDSAASSQRLANLVLRDYSLTVKVIRTANTLHYNRTGRPIRSATHAMLLLGVRTVRDLATSLILFEHYHRKSPGLKELMLLSMLTATHARELAARLGLPEPEEAHLCGMFRNLGEVLIAAHFPEDYAKILEKVRLSGAAAAGTPNAGAPAAPLSMQRAAQSVLGFTYEDLGTAVARHWSMPESVVIAMRAGGATSSRSLAGVVTLSHELTSAIYRDDAMRGALRVADAVRQHGSVLGVNQEAIGEILERALSETKDVFSTARVALDDLRLRKQIADALRVLGAAAGEDGPDAVSNTASRESIDELRSRLVQEARTALEANREFGLEAVVLMLLEALLRGGPFDRAVFAIANAERTMIEGRIGLGAEADALIPKLRVTTQSAPVSLALDWRRAAIRTVNRALTSDETRWCRTVGATAFGVVPLTIDGKLVGCLYADCTSVSAAVEAAGPFLDLVAGLASRAIESRRSGQKAVPSERPPAPSAADQATLVLRVLRGEAAEAVAATAGVDVADLKEWTRVFLDAAMKGLATPPTPPSTR